MGFKLPGKSMTSGTSAHKSALKMRSEKIASAFKQLADVEKQKENMKKTAEIRAAKGLDSGKKMADADWKKGQEKAKAAGGDLDALVKQRKGLKKGTPEYAKVQNKINTALGSKKRYDEGSAKPTKTEKVVAKGETKKAKITAKATKKTAEVDENVTRKSARIAKKSAKKEFGKGSKEHLQAKKAHLEAKEADRQGKKGGRKQTLFRKLASKINKRKQEKIDKKLAEK